MAPEAVSSAACSAVLVRLAALLQEEISLLKKMKQDIETLHNELANIPTQKHMSFNQLINTPTNVLCFTAMMVNMLSSGNMLSEQLDKQVRARHRHRRRLASDNKLVLPTIGVLDILAHDILQCRQTMRMHQTSCVISILRLGGLGKKTLQRHAYPDFGLDRLIQNRDSKTTLARHAYQDFALPRVFQKTISMFNRVQQQLLTASSASDKSIKDTIDFVLGIDKQETFRKKGINMDILRCIVEALAKGCNCDQLNWSDIRPTTCNSLLCTKRRSRYMHTGIKPVQKLPSTRNLETEVVNFSVTDSSLQNGADVSGRIRCPEVDTSFFSPPRVLESEASLCLTGGLNPLLGFHRLGHVFSSACIWALGILFLWEDLCSKRGMNMQHWLWNSRRNKAHRVVSRRCLAQRTRYRKRGYTRLAFQKNRGLISSVCHKPVQEPLLMKSVGIEGVNCSVIESSLQNRAHRIPSADASSRIRSEVGTGFCSPVWVLGSGTSVCATGDSNLLGLRRVDPVSSAGGQSIMSNERGSASVTVNHSQAAPQTRGLVSRSDPIDVDNSSLSPDNTPEQSWRVASAAPQHMTGYLRHLVDFTPSSGDQVIDTPSMGRMAVHGHGSVNTASMTLQDVLYVPGLDANLVSTGQLVELGYTITLGPYGCRIYKDDEDMNLVGKAHYIDGYLLKLDFLRVASTN